MSLRIFHDNRLFDIATLTPSSESSDLPAVNVQDEFRTKVWRTGNTLAKETLTVDFGMARRMRAFIAYYTTVNGWASSFHNPDDFISLSANSSNSFGSPLFNQTVNYNKDFYPGVYGSESSPILVSPDRNILSTIFDQTYQYFQYTFTKPTAGETRDTGRIFLGDYYDMVRAPSRDGITITQVDGSEKFKGIALNTFTEIKDKYKIINIRFPAVPQVDIDNLNEIFSRLGEGVNFFIQIDQDSNNFGLAPLSPYVEIYYVKLNKNYSKQLMYPTGLAPFWSLELEFEEQV